MKISSILQANRWKLCFTLLLLILEAGLVLLFPLFIGRAIDDALNNDTQGAIRLGLLGLATLIIGLGRRLFDSRFYALVYQDIGTKVITEMANEETSIKAARLSMIRELVAFLEHTLPELLFNVIGLLGIMIIIATLNSTIFYASLIVTGLIFFLYQTTSNQTIRLNASSNTEMEKAVDVLNQKEAEALGVHLKEMMRWNIKLSDLEARNFSISWLLLMVFLVTSILVGQSDGLLMYGSWFSLIMYVFQYMENVMNLPFFYQNWLRLREIKERIAY